VKHYLEPTPTPTFTFSPTFSPTFTPTATPTPSIPIVCNIAPQSGFISSQINLFVKGKNLGAVAVKLQNSKISQSISDSALNINGNSLTAQFSLPSAAGLFDLVLTKTGIDYVFKTLFTLLNPVAQPVQWQKTDLGKVGNSGSTGSIVIGDANHDNEAEIFAVTGGQAISMIKNSNSSWPVTNFLSIPGESFQQLLILDGNQDGQLELYVGSARPQLYQYQWGASSPSTALGANGGLLTAGDGNNDGIQEIYAISGNTTTGQGLDQWSYNGVTWTSSAVIAPTAGNIFTALLVGDADNNSLQASSVFAAYQDGSNNTNLCQYKYNGSSWNGTSLTNPGNGAIKSLALGDLDRNGQNEIYVANQDGKIYQLINNNPGWSSIPVNSVNVVCNQIVVGDGDNDGQTEIYGAGQDGHVWQYRLNGSTWQTTDLGNAGTTLNALAVGDGGNHFQFEVYVLGSDGHVYQFKASTLVPTATPSPAAVQVPQNYFKIFHSQINPMRGEQSRIRWTQPQTGPVTIRIFNLLGDKVITLVNNENYSAGEYHEAAWNGKTSRGSMAGSGIYIVLFESPGYMARGKTAVIK
jgi:hypothetical protein